jgi:hypothetical protein
MGGRGEGVARPLAETNQMAEMVEKRWMGWLEREDQNYELMWYSFFFPPIYFVFFTQKPYINTFFTLFFLTCRSMAHMRQGEGRFFFFTTRGFFSDIQKK